MAIKAYYRLNGNSNDASGNGNNGTDASITYSQANGKLNQGAGFNGTSSTFYCQSSSFGISGANPITVSIWVNIFTYNVASNQQTFITRIQQGSSDGIWDKSFYMQGIGSSANIGFQIYDGAGKFAYFNSSLLPVNKWAHLVGKFDGSYVYIYLNSILIHRVAASSTYAETTPRLTVGKNNSADPPSKYFNGLMDELIIDNIAWSDARIKNEYSKAKGFF